MVMEETPSPHCVGREFVRQYYTLLNQAPMHLHRFYNENSSFVHGGLDTPNRETKPVIGQRQIHHRIQQLEFNDCHAKIRQVDSQATLGNGVVVQVTGELSNNGEPMRRFTQTFVLAQQSPKKYYVHNDIFRYQDEMVADEECEPDSGRSEAEEDMDDVQGEATVGVTVSQPVPPTFYMSPAPSQQQQQQQPPPTVQLPNVAPVAAAAANPVNTMASAGLNGSAVTEEVSASGPTTAPVLVSAAPSVVSNASVAVKVEPDEADADDEAEEVVSKVPEVASPPEQELPTTVVVNVEPKTYATLVKSGGASNTMMTPSGPLRPPSPVAVTPESNVSNTSPNSAPSGPAAGNSNAGGDTRNNNASGVNLQSVPQRSPQQAQPARGGMAGSAAAPSGAGSGNMRSGAGPRSGIQDRRDTQNRDSMMEERRRMSGGPLGAGTNMYPDNQQVFVGNVPLATTEEHMREIFSKFGSVLDVRLNCKPSNKCPPGKVFPKYGFIVFNDPAAVQLCLQSRPISMPGDTPHNLNVEEKRNKYRPQMNDERGMGGSRPSMGRAGSGGNMMRGRGSEGGMSRGSRGGSMRGGSEGRGSLRGVGGGSNYSRLR